MIMNRGIRNPGFLFSWFTGQWGPKSSCPKPKHCLTPGSLMPLITWNILYPPTLLALGEDVVRWGEPRADRDGVVCGRTAPQRQRAVQKPLRQTISSARPKVTALIIFWVPSIQEIKILFLRNSPRARFLWTLVRWGNGMFPRNQIHSSVLWCLWILKICMRTPGYNIQMLH